MRRQKDDVNLQSITFLELMNLYHGCDLPEPVQLHLSWESSRFITRFNAIQSELEAARSRSTSEEPPHDQENQDYSGVKGHTEKKLESSGGDDDDDDEYEEYVEEEAAYDDEPENIGESVEDEYTDEEGRQAASDKNHDGKSFLLLIARNLQSFSHFFIQGNCKILTLVLITLKTYPPEHYIVRLAVLK